MLLDTLASIERVRSSIIADVVIVNDGSNEPTTCRILQDLDRDRYQVINQPNGGPAKARNAGIRIARGEFILPLDSDNLIRRAYFDSGLEILTKFPDAGVVYGDAEYFGEQTGRCRVAEFDLRPLVNLNYIDNCALYRRSVWESAGGYDEEKLLAGLEDWDFWMRVAIRGWKFVHIDEIAFDYRVRQGSLVCEARRRHTEIVAYVFEKPEYAALRELKSQGEELERERALRIQCLISRDYRVGSAILAPLRTLKRMMSSSPK